MPNKSKSLDAIEQRMSDVDPDSYRHKVLTAARDFKRSWIELGQYLYSVYKDKLFKDWGYLTFEAYCSKEVGVRQPTALKLLKSYYFLEREEPAYVKKETKDSETKPAKIPSLDAVNTLRLARENENISETDYDELRDEVLNEGKEDKDIKQKIKYILKREPGAASSEEGPTRSDVAKRSLIYLKKLQNEFAAQKMPDKIMRKLDDLVDTLNEYTA